MRCLVSGLFAGLECERSLLAAEPADKLQFVAELESVEELKLIGDKSSWTKDDEARFATQVTAAREAWKSESAKFQAAITREKFAALSRWAKPQ